MKAKVEQEETERKKKMAAKKAMQELNHARDPTPVRSEEEKKLQKIATRGVIKLFNAVERTQKTVEDVLKTGKTSQRKKCAHCCLPCFR